MQYFCQIETKQPLTQQEFNHLDQVYKDRTLIDHLESEEINIYRIQVSNISDFNWLVTDLFNYMPVPFKGEFIANSTDLDTVKKYQEEVNDVLFQTEDDLKKSLAELEKKELELTSMRNDHHILLVQQQTILAKRQALIDLGAFLMNCGARRKCYLVDKLQVLFSLFVGGYTPPKGKLWSAVWAKEYEEFTKVVDENSQPEDPQKRNKEKLEAWTKPYLVNYAHTLGLTDVEKRWKKDKIISSILSKMSEIKGN